MRTKASERIGYRVMRFIDGKAVSGADARIAVELKPGQVHAYPGKGMFLTLDDAYAVDYYANHDHNVLLTYAFDPRQVTSGSLTDRETEVSVPRARLVGYRVLDGVRGTAARTRKRRPFKPAVASICDFRWMSPGRPFTVAELRRNAQSPWWAKDEVQLIKWAKRHKLITPAAGQKYVLTARGANVAKKACHFAPRR